MWWDLFVGYHASRIYINSYFMHVSSMLHSYEGFYNRHFARGQIDGNFLVWETKFFALFLSHNMVAVKLF